MINLLGSIAIVIINPTPLFTFSSSIPSLSVSADPEESDQEDYSASVNAIIQRRASVRKSRRRSCRRPSSPFSPDVLPGTESGRRRSSVYTSSSGEWVKIAF